MLITSCVGFLCNITNFIALNTSCCGSTDEDSDEEDPDGLGLSTTSLTQQLRSIYQPRQAHKCIHQESTHHSIDEEELEQECHHTNCLEAGNQVVPGEDPEADADSRSRQRLIDSHEKAKKKKKSEDNMNVKAAIVHMIGDMVQSIGVITASLIIMFKPEWHMADPICTFLFSILVLMTTVPIFIECTQIIMEATPGEIDTVQLFNDIQALKTVEEVHDFHCWSLAGGKHVMTCHIRSKFGDVAIKDVNRICKGKDYNIYHTTVQVERERRDAHVISCDFLF